MTVSLVKAATDPRLLGATIDPWPKQRELLASLDGPEGTHIWAIGRQASKSTMAALAAVHNAMLRPDLDAMMQPGRTRYVLVACPREDQAREFVRLCAALVEASPLLASTAEVKANTIEFVLPRDGGRARTAIKAMPANARSVRGLTASMVILDEFAHMIDTDGSASDERMLEALVPSMRLFGDLARLLVISTPFGETGKFYELFRDAQAGLLPSTRVVQAPVWDVAPGIDEAWIEARRAQLGDDRFRQEYGAEFVSGAGQFFDLRGVELDDGPAQPEDGRRWVAGLDPAFHGDRFGVALVAESAHYPGVLVVGRLEGLVPKAGAKSMEGRRAREDATLAAVAEILESYAPRIVTDQHQADGVRSYFGRLGHGVKVENLTGPSQTAAFTSTRARLMDGSLRLWKHAQLLEELRRVRARDTEKIELPRFGGSHCDIASALALAVYELRHIGAGSNGRPVFGVARSIAGGAADDADGTYTAADALPGGARRAPRGYPHGASEPGVPVRVRDTSPFSADDV